MGKNEAWFLCEPVLSWQRLGIKPMSAEVFCFNMSCRVPFFSLMLSSLCPFFTSFILCPSLPNCCAALSHLAGPAVTRVWGSLGRPASAPTGGCRTAVDAAAAGRPSLEDRTCGLWGFDGPREDRILLLFFLFLLLSQSLSLCTLLCSPLFHLPTCVPLQACILYTQHYPNISLFSGQEVSSPLL